MNILEKEKLKSYTGLTVGALKRFIEEFNIPDNAPVVMQRIEDVYFEQNNWGVYLKEGENFYNIKAFNKEMEDEISRREKGEEYEYPGINDPLKLIQETSDEDKTQYIPMWSCVHYKDDADVLFIDAHY